MKSIMSFVYIFTLWHVSSTVCTERAGNPYNPARALLPHPDQRHAPTRYLPGCLQEDIWTPTQDDFLVDTALQEKLAAAHAHIERMTGENNRLRSMLNKLSYHSSHLESQMQEERISREKENKRLTQERDIAIQQLGGSQTAYQLLLQEKKASTRAHNNALASIATLNRTIEKLSQEQQAAATTIALLEMLQKRAARIAEPTPTATTGTQDTTSTTSLVRIVTPMTDLATASSATPSIRLEPKPTATESNTSSKRQKPSRRAKKRASRSNVPNWRKQG